MKKSALIQRTSIGAVYPGILQCSEAGPAIYDRRGLSTVEEGLVQLHVEDVKPYVDIDPSG
jgi:hypothetical protein